MREHSRNRKKRQSLSDQLIRMVMFTFLPVNVLAIAVSSMILAKVSGQVREFCQRDLDAVMNQIQADLLETEEAFSDFFLDYLTELTLSDINSPMAAYDMLTDLHDDFKQSGGEGVYYLYDKRKDRLYLRHSAGCYPVRLIEGLKETLLGQCREMEEKKETAPAQWQLCPLEGEYFLGRQYDYLNYRIGFFLDMERLLEKRGTSRLWKENRVYLSDDEGMAYSYGEGHMKPFPEESFDRIFEPKLFDRNVLWERDNPDICVGIEVVSRDFRGGIPTSYWVLLWVSFASIFLSVVMWKMLKKRVVDSLFVLRDAMEELEKENLS